MIKDAEVKKPVKYFKIQKGMDPYHTNRRFADFNKNYKF